MEFITSKTTKKWIQDRLMKEWEHRNLEYPQTFIMVENKHDAESYKHIWPLRHSIALGNFVFDMSYQSSYKKSIYSDRIVMNDHSGKIDLWKFFNIYANEIFDNQN